MTLTVWASLGDDWACIAAFQYKQASSTEAPGPAGIMRALEAGTLSVGALAHAVVAMAGVSNPELFLLSQH